MVAVPVLVVLVCSALAPAHALIERPPPNKAKLLWTDGIEDGGTTTLLQVTITAVYGSNVTGTSLSDFVVTGGDTSDFYVMHDYMSRCLFTLSGQVVEVEARMNSFSGSVFPPLDEDVAITLRCHVAVRVPVARSPLAHPPSPPSAADTRRPSHSTLTRLSRPPCRRPTWSSTCLLRSGRP